MKLITLTAFALAAFALTAETNSVVDKAERAKRFKAALYRRTGGECVRPGTQKGEVFYVDCQSKVPSAWIADSLADFAKLTSFKMTLAKGTFALPKPTVRSEATLFVVDDSALPPLLVAPESRWAMVNVAGLSEGRGAKESYFKARVRKELVRGAALLLGSQDSGYPNTLMGCMTKPADLDQMPDAQLPVDVVQRFRQYAHGYGITPAEKTVYKVACQEGWAPAPTNEFQKAIWDQVHAVPKNPMKIEFDPKKGR